MKDNFKFLAAAIVLSVIFGCGFLKDKVEEKVSEEIDEQVKESQRKIDSIMESTNFDSLEKNLDSLMQDLEKTDKEIDSLSKELDSKYGKNK